MLFTGSVGILQRNRLQPHLHRVRTGIGVDTQITSTRDFLLCGTEESRLGGRLLLEESIQFVHGGNVAEALRVKFKKGLVEIGQVTVPQTREPRLDLLSKLAIVMD